MSLFLRRTEYLKCDREWHACAYNSLCESLENFNDEFSSFLVWVYNNYNQKYWNNVGQLTAYYKNCLLLIIVFILSTLRSKQDFQCFDLFSVTFSTGVLMLYFDECFKIKWHVAWTDGLSNYLSAIMPYLI